MKTLFDLSIIIPFKDEIESLKIVLTSIGSQVTKYTYEVIILDSSREKFQFDDHEQKLNIRWINIDPSTYNHGGTRNLGVSLANSRYIIFTVQDAKPSSVNWIEITLATVISNNLDACCGRQIVPHKRNMNPIEWHRPFDQPRIRILEIDTQEFINLNGGDKKKLTCWDNVNAIYKKNSLEKLPFREMLFGEDAQWAIDALTAGLKLGYNEFSTVEHYHFYSGQFAIKRYLAYYYMTKVIYDINPVKPKLTIRQIFIWIKLLIRSQLKLSERIYWFKYNMALFKASQQSFKLFNNEMNLKEIERELLINAPMSRKNEK